MRLLLLLLLQFVQLVHTNALLSITLEKAIVIAGSVSFVPTSSYTFCIVGIVYKLPTNNNAINATNCITFGIIIFFNFLDVSAVSSILPPVEVIELRNLKVLQLLSYLYIYMEIYFHNIPLLYTYILLLQDQLIYLPKHL